MFDFNVGCRYGWCIPIIFLFIILGSFGDRLDDLMSKHWPFCGQSFPTDVNSKLLNQLTKQSLDYRFDFITKYRRTCGLESAQLNVTNRIVGGINALPGEFPWQVSLRRYNDRLKKWYHFCGAVIIDNRWLLTAAHCVLPIKNPLDIRARIGEYNFSRTDSNEIDLNISKIIVHDQFNFFTLEPDICLLQLEENLDLGPNSKFRSICFPQKLNSKLPTNSDAICVSTGWGKKMFRSYDYLNDHFNDFPSVLQKVCVDLIDWNDCRRRYEELMNITETMICSGQGGKGTCEGDSGGPLQCVEKISFNIPLPNGIITTKTNFRFALYGLTSWAIGCGEDQYPSVGSNINTVRDWIVDQILANDLVETSTTEQTTTTIN